MFVLALTNWFFFFGLSEPFTGSGSDFNLTLLKLILFIFHSEFSFMTIGKRKLDTFLQFSFLYLLQVKNNFIIYFNFILSSSER